MAITKTYSMKKSTLEELEKYAKENDVKLSAVVDSALKQYLNMKEENE